MANYYNMADQVRAFSMIHETTAGDTDVDAHKVLDMAGYEGVLFVGSLKTVTAAGEAQIQLQMSDSSSTTDMVDTTAGAAGSTATSTDHELKTILLDVYRPQKRYVSCRLWRNTQVSEASVVALQYGPLYAPVTQSTEQYGCIQAYSVATPTT